MKIKAVLIISTILFSVTSFSQSFKKEKRIYMLDITKSMWGLGDNPDIFDKVKEALYKGISKIDNPETLITVIPFQGTYTYEQESLPLWTFSINDGTLKEVKKIINSYDIKSVPNHNTDIYSALEKAKQEVDPNRINYIYLLTDGKQSKKGKTIKYDEKDLKELLNNWCYWANDKDAYLFYVMLTEKAKNETIVNIVKKQCRAFVVNGANVDIAFIKPSSSNLVINLHDNPTNLKVLLDANDWNYIQKDTKIKLDLEPNSIFKLTDNEVDIINNKIIVDIKPFNGNSFEELRHNSPVQANLKLNISTDFNIKILAPELNITVKNKKERVLKLEFVDDEE